MAVTIKLKNASGSDPGASDLVVGELAIRTDNGKIFTKKDNGSVAEISGGGGIDDGDKGDITVSNSGQTFTIDNGVVTGNKIASDTITGSNINNPLSLPDDHKISFGTGTGNNMEIFHESTSNTNEIIAADGDIHIQCDDFMVISDSTAGRSIYVDEGNSRLELGFDGHANAYFSGTGGIEFIKDVKFDGATAGRDIVFDRSEDALEFADNAQARFGTGDDLKIYSDGTDSIFENITGAFLFKDTDGEAEFKIQGHEGAAASLFLLADEGDDSNDRWKLTAHTDGKLVLNHHKASTSTYQKTAQFTNEGGTELYHGGSKVFETNSTGVTMYGGLLPSPHGGFDIGNSANMLGNVFIYDDKKLNFGISSDLQIYHDGSHSRIVDSGTGYLVLETSRLQVNNAAGNEEMIVAIEGGAVELFHDNSKKFDTVSGGARIFGYLSMQGSGGHIYLPDSAELKVGSGEDLKIYHDGTDSILKNSTNVFRILGDNIQIRNSANNETGFKFAANGAVELYYDNSKKFETTSSGATVTGTCTATTFSGSGASLTSLNADNISSGTLASARIENSAITSDKLNNAAVTFAKMQNISQDRIIGRTGSGSGSATDLTATQARALLNVADGATNVTNNNQLTNGAGYITAAQAASGNATTLDSLDSTQFVRSDANDTLTGNYTFSNSSDEKIILSGSTNPYIRWQEGTTNKAYIQWNSAGYFDIVNQETGENIRIGSGSNGLQYIWDGNTSTVWHSGNDGSGSGLDADTLDGVQASGFVAVGGDTMTGTLTTRTISVGSGYMLLRNSHHSGHFVGGYNNIGANSTNSNPIFTIGSNYNPASTTLSNMYGIGFTNGNASFAPSGAGWGMYVASDGDSRVYLDGSNGRVYMGAYNAGRYLSDAQGDYGSVQINGDGRGGWEGFSIDGRAVFMHDGSSTTGIYNDVNNEWMVHCAHNAAVSLYYNGSQKMFTTSGGIDVTGRIDINDTNTQVQEGSGNAVRISTNSGYIDVGAQNSSYAHFTTDRNLFYFGRTSNFAGSVRPHSNNSYDLGTSSLRWANLYVNDMHFANSVENPNKVDGTWGDWTLQEGEDTIFMLNNRNGKKYKMNLTEV